MTLEQHGIKKAAPSLPARDLLVVPFRGNNLTVGWPAFGPDTYRNNIAKMQERYSHSSELPVITFRPATTAESIAAVACNFAKLAKPQIFDPNFLQAGYTVGTQCGVYVNPPIGEDNKPTTDEKKLKKLLEKGEKIKVGKGHIYFMQVPEIRDFGFAEYETFKGGVQESGEFIEGGLARVLEHTRENVAPNLKRISAPKLYNLGVNAWGFDAVSKSVLGVVGLGSAMDALDIRLGVVGDIWDDDDGYAFGVLENAGDTKSKALEHANTSVLSRVGTRRFFRNSLE